MPINSSKIFQLMDYLDHGMQSSTTGLAQLLVMVETDIMLLLLMWKVPLWGNEIDNCKVSFTKFFLHAHDGQPIQTCPCVHPQDSCKAYPADPEAQRDQNSRVPEVRAFHSDSHSR